MNDKAQLLARYQRLRQVGMRVNHNLVERLPKDVMNEGGRMLGILHRNTLVLDSEDEIAVLMDFCIHDVRRGGRNAVERFLAEKPYPFGSDEAAYLQSLEDAYYSLFVIEGTEPGVGATVRDELYGGSKRIVDVGLSQSGAPGFLLASRLIEVEGMAMTGGALLPLGMLPMHRGVPLGPPLMDEVRAKLGSARTPDERSEVTAIVIRTALQKGAAEHVAYGEPGELPFPQRGMLPRASRPAEDIAPYGPCPCGSGKKYKFCCRARR